MAPQTVLVTGANGFLGCSVAKAFSLAGWTTYGLIRSQNNAANLLRNEVIPVIGSAADPSFLFSLPALDVVISTTEDLENYVDHFNDTLTLLKLISQRANKKLLVLFTSGCKDYGTTKKHGEAGLAPHNEEDPLNPPTLLSNRTKYSLTILDHQDCFDGIVLRPTTLYGYSGSYYALFFILAQKAKDSGHGALTIDGHPNAVLHGTHVDDVAAAYVALASAPRANVKGKIYNISSKRYETLQDIVGVIENEYKITVQYKEPETSARAEDKRSFQAYLVDFPQWVDSEKIRNEIGWNDRKMIFSEGFGLYRKAHEQALADHDEGVIKIKNTLNASLDVGS